MAPRSLDQLLAPGALATQPLVDEEREILLQHFQPDAPPRSTSVRELEKMVEDRKPLRESEAAILKADFKRLHAEYTGGQVSPTTAGAPNFNDIRPGMTPTERARVAAHIAEVMRHGRG